MVELNSLESNIWKMHLRSMLAQFTLFTPVIVLFFQDNGLSMTQITILQSAFSAAIILLEVPSGYFADLYGRKTSLTLSGAFLSSGIGIYSIGNGFFEFLVAELVFAVGGSLASGAGSALVYDTLEELDKESMYQKIWGKASYYGLMSAALASIAGGVIGDYSLRATLYGMVPFYLILIPLSYSLKEPKTTEKVSKDASKSMKGVFRYCFSNKRLRWLILYSAIITGGIKAGYFLYQPYFKLTGLDVSLFGFVFAGLNVISAVSSKKAYILEDILGEKKSLASLMILASAAFFLMGYFKFSFAFIFAGIHNIVRGASGPIISDYVNKVVSSERRSTFLSAKNLISKGIYAAAFPFIGVITDNLGYQAAFNILGLSTMLTCTVLLVFMKLSRTFDKS